MIPRRISTLKDSVYEKILEFKEADTTRKVLSSTRELSRALLVLEQQLKHIEK